MSSAYDIVMSNRKEIVDKLIAQMEKGYAATRVAWNAYSTDRPYNPVSRAVYKGGNRFRLMIAAEENGFSDPRWMTFKQAAEEKYKIAPGSKGVLLEKWIFHKDVPKLDESGKTVITTDGKPETERITLKKPIVNYFRVFNGEQIIGLPELEQREVTEDDFSKLAAKFEKSSKCPINYDQQDKAFYSAVMDEIHLPLKHAFKNNETRLSILLHEMAHSTGHETRLNRPLGNKFGSVEYAKEELNAELSSVFLESELGITMDADSELLKDHANYVKSWIAVLKDNPNELFVACANAEHITEFLLENYEKELEMEEAMQADKEAKITVAIENTEDYADAKIGFYTYHYPGGREGVRYRLVTMGEDGVLRAYPDANRFFINEDLVNEYVEAHADQLNVISYDDMVYQAGAKQAIYQIEANQRISMDIEQAGLKASPQLVQNISSFEKLEGRQYTVEDLKELIQNHPDYSDQPDKKACLEEISAELKKQESVSMLENRYKAAMQVLGYEQLLDDAVAKDGFLVFENEGTGERRIIDGWQAVGEYLEEVEITELPEETRTYFESLIHPEGRVEYYTKFPEADVPVEVYKSFEEACSAYDRVELMSGKTLGFSIEGRSLDLIWFEARSMEHNLYRATKAPASYAPECTVNELKELETNTKKVVSSLQKENAYIQVMEAVTDLEYSVCADIGRGNSNKEWIARVASELRPQDYVEIKIKRSESELQMKTNIVHANEIIQENVQVTSVENVVTNGIKAFSNEEYPTWLHQQVVALDTDYMAMGQRSFNTYADFSFFRMEDHYEKLEMAGYEQEPSKTITFGQGEEFTTYDSIRRAEIEKDIVKSGFKASPQLIDNISKLERLEGKQYTLRDLAELKRSHPDFNKSDKKSCFEAIIKECQEQELGQEQNQPEQKPSFLRQEMMMEQMQITSM